MFTTGDYDNPESLWTTSYPTTGLKTWHFLLHRTRTSARDAALVLDYLKLRATPVAEEGEIRFELREDEYESSYFDQIALLAHLTYVPYNGTIAT